jgi:hypothetical protein
MSNPTDPNKPPPPVADPEWQLENDALGLSREQSERLVSKYGEAKAGEMVQRYVNAALSKKRLMSPHRDKGRR